jgi:hypothetical protein
MGLVEVDQRPVLAGDAHQFGQVHDLAGHGEDRVGHDQPWRAGLEPRHLLVQVGNVVVGVADVADAEAGQAVDDAGVVVAVGEHLIAPTAQAGERPLVRHEPRGEQHRLGVAQEVGDLFLEGAVFGDGAVEQPATGAAGAVALQRVAGGLHDLRVPGQAQVVVGPEHQGFAAADADDGTVERIVGDEIGADALLGPGEADFNGRDAP